MKTYESGYIDISLTDASGAAVDMTAYAPVIVTLKGAKSIDFTPTKINGPNVEIHISQDDSAALGPGIIYGEISYGDAHEQRKSATFTLKFSSAIRKQVMTWE